MLFQHIWSLGLAKLFFCAETVLEEKVSVAEHVALSFSGSESIKLQLCLTLILFVAGAVSSCVLGGRQQA